MGPTLMELDEQRAVEHADSVVRDLREQMKQLDERHPDNRDTHSPEQYDETFKHNVDRAFELFDFYGAGHIDIRFLDRVLGEYPGLGYHVDRALLGKLIAKYDKDSDRCLDMDEFQRLLKDPLLHGRWYGRKVVLDHEWSRATHATTMMGLSRAAHMALVAKDPLASQVAPLLGTRVANGPNNGDHGDNGV